MISFCGLPDVMPLQEKICKWPAPEVTWALLSYSDKLSRNDQLEAFQLAWSWWAEICAIKPKYSPNSRTANVLISFGGIDGGSGTLAWSELPCGSAERLRQMYDSSERWVVEEKPAHGFIDLARVAAHEIGHGIGIPHIASGNLMAPTYSRSIRRPQNGDLREAQLRYGKPSPVPVPPGPSPDPEENKAREIMRKRLELYLAIAGGLAKVTSTEWDDKIVAAGKSLVAQDWFVDIMVYLLARFSKTEQPVTMDQFADAVQEFRLMRNF